MERCWKRGPAEELPGERRKATTALQRPLGVTPHVEQNLKRNDGSAIDGRTITTRHQRLSCESKKKEADRRMLWVAVNPSNTTHDAN
jgi:hypothetical protein